MEFPIEYKGYQIRVEKETDGPQLKHFSDKLVEERALIGLKEKRTKEDLELKVKNNLKRMKLHKTVQLIAEKNSKIMGWAGISLFPQKMDHFGGLGISLDKSARGIGLGSKMMESIIDWAKIHLNGLECIELGVIPENVPAKMLYAKFGFQVVACLPKKIKHFGSYYDEEIMYLWVNSDNGRD